jgi:hypothetical protein
MTKTLKTVVEIDGPVRTVKMPSLSRRDVTHTVTFACTCEGFTFAGYCYHLAEAARVLKEDATAARLHTKVRLCLRDHK